MLPRRSSLPAWARRLGIALAGLLLLGIAGEVLLRLAPGLGDPQTVIRMQGERGAAVYVADPELGARLAPSQHALVDTLDYTYTLQTDHAGFPNPEPWPSRIDIAVLGNSLLDGPGLGLDGELTALLEHRLGGRSALNFTLPGAGTRHEYLMYRKYAEPLQPKVVVALLWVIWDIDNSLHFDRWLSENRPDPDFTHYRFTFRATHQDGPRRGPDRHRAGCALFAPPARQVRAATGRLPGPQFAPSPPERARAGRFPERRHRLSFASRAGEPRPRHRPPASCRYARGPLSPAGTTEDRGREARWPLRRRPDAEQGRAVRRGRLSGRFCGRARR